MSVGPWQDDSVPAWRQSAFVRSTDYQPTFTPPLPGGAGYLSLSHTTPGAWAGPFLTRTPNGAYRSRLNTRWNNVSTFEAYNGDFTEWDQVWTPLTRPANFTVATGTLPASVWSGGAYVNPNVVSHEWEPATTPAQQRLIVRLIPGGLWARSDGTGITTGLTTVSVKQASGVVLPDTTYDPGFLTGTAFASQPTIGTFVPTSGTVGSVTIPDPNIPLTGAAAIALSVLDPYTQGQTVPPRPAPASPSTAWVEIELWFSAELQGLFAPRYRLTYSRNRIPHQRGMQRGSDGQGITGGARGLQRKSRQSSLRGGSIL